MPQVALKITDDMLRTILRLPDTWDITGAGVERFPAGDDNGGLWSMLVLELDIPGAPSGAVEVQPSYRRAPGPDPITLVEVCWVDADGVRAIQSMTAD